MHAPIIVKILFTGICAIVPSASDKDLTRIVAPNAMYVAMTDHKMPEHFAFVEVSTKNFLPADRLPDFRFHAAGDADGVDRLVFIVQSEEIELETPPANTTLTGNGRVPKDAVHPDASEMDSTFYVLKMPIACPKCGPLKNEYFDVFGHPDMVALRMDLRGGRESTESTNFDKVWHFKGTSLEQPLAESAVFAFDVPAEVERLVLTRASDRKQTHIALFSPDGAPIEVTVGNEPLRDILLLDFKLAHVQHLSLRDHFPLIYAMFESTPPNPPLPELIPRKSHNVRGVGDDCIPPQPAPQDPKPRPIVPLPPQP